MRDTVVTNTAALWGIGLRVGGCPNCGAAHLLPVEQSAPTCPNCFAAQLVAQPARLHPIPPELYLPFTVNKFQLFTALNDWMRGVWPPPDELDVHALQTRAVKTYLPLWLVDGAVVGSWQARVGYDDQSANAQKDHEARQAAARWESRSGALNQVYHNVTAPALEDHDQLMSRLGGYPIQEAIPYNITTLYDAVVRAPSLLPDEAWPRAQTKFDKLAAADCRAAADAQYIDEFKLQAEYRDRNWTQLLLPVYTTAYRDDAGNVIPVMINGQTGQVAGKRRASRKKGWLWSGLIAVVAVLCFIAAAALSLLWALSPLIVLLSAFLFLVSLVIAFVAPLPALYVWRTNHSE